MFEGFSPGDVEVSGTTIHAVCAGSGAPLLLLHGYPQTHVMWHRIAPILAQRFTVVCPDLRGYGDSGKPPSEASHRTYSKRLMAQDQVELMEALGFERFAVIGHDRGARVARRIALDHPGVVTKAAFLDIVPTATVYASLDQARAMTVWRYVFLTQPPDLPERLIAADPGFYLDWTLREWSGSADGLTEAAVSEYRRCFTREVIHATCEDYRAGATVDLDDDRADAHEKLSCPVLVLWSTKGIGSDYDVLSVWRGEANDVRGRGLACGHFLAEERPEETASELMSFLGDGDARV